MALPAGSRLGPYEILAPIGAGGMGEVYRARDTKLKRDVALKVLPEAVATDPGRLARFQREAEVLASLNHPNIASIYGVEDRALVMEFVEGETLKGPLPLETALDYALQIAQALEAAHEKGIIHRDLKPSNVKITPGKRVKVLDFGLAKSVDETAVERGDALNQRLNGQVLSETEDRPTMTQQLTHVGTILGTAPYMSPEQAQGETVDRRSDIWSFGAVLYELLSGKCAFSRESTSDTLAAVLVLDPDWNALPADTPASIHHLLRRCLTKPVKQRLQAIGEARIVLEESSKATLDIAEPVLSGEEPLNVYVLCAEIVDSTNQTSDVQQAIKARLTGLISATHEFRAARAKGDLISLSTADELALVFLKGLQAPMRCALEISQALKLDRFCTLRMGIHAGAVVVGEDINGKTSVSGAGLRAARQVTRCGSGGHILVSSAAADSLYHLTAWRDKLTDLGAFRLGKEKVHVWNFVDGDIGSTKRLPVPSAPRVQMLKRLVLILIWLAFLVGYVGWRNHDFALGASFGLVIGVGVLFWRFWWRTHPKRLAARRASRHSIFRADRD